MYPHHRPGEQAAGGAAERDGRVEHAARDAADGERAEPLGVRLPLGDPLPVEVGHLLDEVEVMQQDRAVGADGKRVLLTRDRDTRIGRRRLGLCARHMDDSFLN